MKRHGLDPFSLVFGTTFALLGTMFLFTRTDVATLHLRWIWPLPLIVLGALVIAVAARSERHPPDRDGETEVAPLGERSS